jgi:hypothetical protein
MVASIAVSDTGLRQLADALSETGLLGMTVLVVVGGTIAASDTHRHVEC